MDDEWLCENEEEQFDGVWVATEVVIPGMIRCFKGLFRVSV